MGLVGIYPGSFDPFTRGHGDITKRAARFVSKLIIGIAEHNTKTKLFTVEERHDMIQASICDMPADLVKKIRILAFDDLLVNFVRRNQADVVFRGLRATTDFEYEFQMASINRKLDENVDTLFLTASDKYQFISSSMVREITQLGGNIENYVSLAVNNKLKEKLLKK